MTRRKTLLSLLLAPLAQCLPAKTKEPVLRDEAMEALDEFLLQDKAFWAAHEMGHGTAEKPLVIVSDEELDMWREQESLMFNPATKPMVGCDPGFENPAMSISEFTGLVEQLDDKETAEVWASFKKGPPPLLQIETNRY